MTGTPPARELYIDAKWDSVIDLTLRRVVYGTGVAGLASLLLLRKRCPPPPAPRMLPACLAAATGRPRVRTIPVVRHTALGLPAGAGGPTSRTAFTAFGAGVGLGSAWQQCSKEVRVCPPKVLGSSPTPAACLTHAAACTMYGLHARGHACALTACAQLIAHACVGVQLGYQPQANRRRVVLDAINAHALGHSSSSLSRSSSRNDVHGRHCADDGYCPMRTDLG